MMTLKKFKKIARRAISDLPVKFHPHVNQLVIIVRDHPSKKLLRELEMLEDEDLFGLYEGVALTERHTDSASELPPTIILFYKPLLNACETEAELTREIQTTVLHEIGHFFGLDEDQLAELDY
ncbi:MAG: metallopeptidase family protein [Planctomycetota bacterium]